MGKKDHYLIIPDYHAPFGHKQALKFCKELQKDFEVPEENVICLGDFEDQYNFSSHPKSPDRKHTMDQELEATREEIRKWAHAFPRLKMCTSNHGSRIFKRMIDAELSTQLLRNYEEIFNYPKGWQLKEEFVICATRHEFICQHGEGFSGPRGHIDAAMANGLSTVIGHLHSFAGVSHIRTRHQNIWAVNSGCLIDQESYAFEYAKNSKFKATIGATVILDGGRFPIFVPL